MGHKLGSNENFIGKNIIVVVGRDAKNAAALHGDQKAVAHRRTVRR